MEIHKTTAKSIIVSTKVPSADFVINPYTGCQFTCMYCFAISTVTDPYQGVERKFRLTRGILTAFAEMTTKDG